MIVPALNTLTNKLREIEGLHVISGSLRQHQVTVPTPAAIVVPLEFKSSRTGLQYNEVGERYEIVLCVSSRKPNPYQELINLAVLVSQHFYKWLPPAWDEHITVKNVNISSVRFDTHPEGDELGLVTASLEVEITYYSV